MSTVSKSTDPDGDYRRLYINTAYPSISYIYLTWRSYRNVLSNVPENHKELRRYLTHPNSPIVQLFTDEWAAKAVKLWDGLAKKTPTKVFNKKINLLTCLPPDKHAAQNINALNVVKYTNIRIFWFASPDVSFKEIGLCVSSIAGDPLKAVSPYDQLFTLSGLPFREGFTAAPRDHFGMEKLVGEEDEFRVWRKQSVVATAEQMGPVTQTLATSGRRDLPPELWSRILKYVAAEDSRTDLMPMMLWARLVNRTWHEISTSLYYAAVTIPKQMNERFIKAPKANIYPHLRRIDIRSNWLNTLGPPFRDSRGYIMRGELLEEDLVCFIENAPNLEELTLSSGFGSPGKVYITGWTPANTITGTPPTDIFERNLIAKLDACAVRVRDLVAQYATCDVPDWALSVALSSIFRDAPSRLFLLGPPGDSLMAAYGRFLIPFVHHFSAVYSPPAWQNWDGAVAIEFDVLARWPYNKEAIPWFERTKPWKTYEWPAGVPVHVCGVDWASGRQKYREVVGVSQPAFMLVRADDGSEWWFV